LVRSSLSLNVVFYMQQKPNHIPLKSNPDGSKIWLSLSLSDGTESAIVEEILKILVHNEFNISHLKCYLSRNFVFFF